MMTRASIALGVLLMLIFGSHVRAQEIEPSDLLIYNVWVRPTAPEPADDATPEPPIPGTVSGAYLTIENTSAHDYRLVGAASLYAETADIHESKMDGNIMRMRRVESIDIPAGETVTLAPNGYHVMLMDVTRDFYAGTAVPLALTFADENGASTEIRVAALVTDDPPVEESMIAANAWARVTDPVTADVFLILDNRGDEDDTLIGAANPTARWSELRQDREVIESVEVPSHMQTILAPERVEVGMAIRLNGLRGTLTMAFPLELWFASGKKLIVPVYVRSAAAD